MIPFNPVLDMIAKQIIIIIDLIMHHPLTRVKHIALYKQLDKNHIYEYFNKQNLEYIILP